MSAIVIQDGLVHYEVIGRGRPLVFIHGWLGSWRYWVPAMEESSAKYRAYALDLWGFGDSDKLRDRYSIDAYIQLLGDFLDNLGVGVLRPTLIGHALGGVVALRFAARAPELVEQVLGVSVPLVGAAIHRPLASFSGNEDALARLAARRASFPEVELEVRKTDVSAITGSTHSVMVSDLGKALSPLDVPVLLVYGGDDPLVAPPQQEWLQECDDNVRTIFLNGARHFPMLEERSKFNRLLMDFLDAGDDLSSLKLKEEWQRRQR
jgi:pimeloyl-ACP methyl ester carboxylesterase